MDAVNVYVFQFVILANACVVHLGRGVPDSPQQRRFIMGGGGLARLTCTFTFCFVCDDDMPHHHTHKYDSPVARSGGRIGG